MKVPYSRPEIGPEEKAAAMRVLDSGWLTTGKEAQAFEQEFKDYLNRPALQCLAVNSATAGLHLALEAMGVGPGDEVIVPTMTFTATAEVVRYLGATPVFTDIDPETMCMTVEGIEDAMTEQTKVVIPVHYAGLACEVTEIVSHCHQHEVLVLEDAAHALPSTYDKRLVGTGGADATVFSFYANKTLTTGEGGMIVTPHDDYAKRMSTMSLHGIDRPAFDRFSAPGNWYYDVVAPGFKYNMTDLAAAIGREQLRKVERMAQRRAEIARQYLTAFNSLPVQLPYPGTMAREHAWHLFVLRLLPQAPMGRNQLMQALTAAGIGFSLHYTPLHRMTYWRESLNLDIGDYPEAERCYDSMISLPIFSTMTQAEVQRVIEVVTRSLV